MRSTQNGTYMIAIKLSLELLATRCLALHIRISDQAPIASQNVHSTDAVSLEGERNVVNKERYSGDWYGIS